MLGSTIRVYNSVDSGVEPENSTNRVPHTADTAGPGTTLWDWLVQIIQAGSSDLVSYFRVPSRVTKKVNVETDNWERSGFVYSHHRRWQLLFLENVCLK